MAAVTSRPPSIWRITVLVTTLTAILAAADAIGNDTMTTVVGGASTAGELEAGLGNSRTGAAGSGAADTVRNAVVATVVGIGCLATLIVMAVCVVLHCHFTRDKVGALDDDMEYSYQDEYEACINFDVLDKLDPSLREKIDLDFLAQLTNTDPALLEKYKVKTEASEGDRATNSFGSSPQLHPLSSSQSSLHGISVVPNMRRSSTVKQHSMTSSPRPPPMKRVSTFTDIKDLLNTSLNISQRGLTGHTSLMRKSHDQVPHGGSHPNVNQGQKSEDMTKQLLRLLTAVKLAEQNSEQEAAAINSSKV